VVDIDESKYKRKYRRGEIVEEGVLRHIYINQNNELKNNNNQILVPKPISLKAPVTLLTQFPKFSHL